MQRPEDNPEGYSETSLLPLAGELDAPLLLVHGQADDNVHFANTALLIEALVEAGKQLDVMVYPGRAHGIRGPKPRTQLFTKITRFLERHL
jgi:dipeptidyl-peptidase-4